MGAYYKLGLIILVILFFVMYSIFYYLIYPKLKIYLINKVLMKKEILKNIDIRSLTPSLKIDLINRLCELEKLNPIDYGYIFFNKEKGEFLLLKNSKEIELASYNNDFPNLHKTNKFYVILMSNLFSNKLYCYAYYNNALIITRQIKSNTGYMIFIRFSSISLFNE